MAIQKFAESNEKSEPLIPGLPDEIAEQCLLRVPYPYQALARSVSSSWNRAITSHGFALSKKALCIARPFLFVLAFDRSTARIQWQALDPRSCRWFVLPPMPCPDDACPSGFACASIPLQGKLFVLGGMRKDTGSSMRTAVVYSSSSNQWTVMSPMLTARSFFAAGSIGDKIYVVGGSGPNPSDSVSTIESYDPETDTWAAMAKLRRGLARYDAAVVGNKMCVTEGWTWPFVFSPKGGVYEAEGNTWGDMSDEMRDGWTGVSVVMGERLFTISEHGDCRMKVYDSEKDAWSFVGGGMFPCERVQRPFAVVAMEQKIYVVSRGLNVGIGRVCEEGKRVLVEWEVVEAPKAFSDFCPCSCQVVYA